MRSENFQADFLKIMASATYATFKNTSHQHLFCLLFVFLFLVFSRNVITYQNNERNLQIWYMLISQIAQF